jgi:hypothetical protein
MRAIYKLGRSRFKSSDSSLYHITSYHQFNTELSNTTRLISTSDNWIPYNEYNIIQYATIQHNTIHYRTLQHSTIPILLYTNQYTNYSIRYYNYYIV